MDLAEFNQMVRDWADRQPEKYRKSALAFGFPCNRHTHSFDQTLQWISNQTRWRNNGADFVSAVTLRRHLKVFAYNGVISVERRRRNGQNCSSEYRVHFDRVIKTEDVTVDPWADAWP